MEDEIKKSVKTSLCLIDMKKDSREFMATLITANVMKILNEEAL